MSELDSLGNALSGQLHAIVSDLNPSDELWARVDAISDRGVRPRIRERLTRRRLAFTLPLPLAACAGAAALVFGGAAPSASFGSGVTWLPNGDVNMRIEVLTDPARANAVFRRVHYPAVAIPMTASCRYHGFSYLIQRVRPPVVNLYERGLKVDRHYVTVQAAKVVGHNRLLLAVKGRVPVDHVPSCASSHGNHLIVRPRDPGSLPKFG